LQFLPVPGGYLQLLLPGGQDGIGLPSAIAAGTAVDPYNATTLSKSTTMRRAFFM